MTKAPPATGLELGPRERRGMGAGGLVSHYTRQLLLGLAFLHFNGIAHRDMKSANILATTGMDGEHLFKSL